MIHLQAVGFVSVTSSVEDQRADLRALPPVCCLFVTRTLHSCIGEENVDTDVALFDLIDERRHASETAKVEQPHLYALKAGLLFDLYTSARDVVKM
jgi:hypothetical protein